MFTYPSALNAGAKRNGATCHMAMPQCCYLAKEAKRPSHTTIMQPFQLSVFTFGTQLSAFGKFIKVIYLGLNCRGAQLTLFAFGTQSLPHRQKVIPARISSIL